MASSSIPTSLDLFTVGNVEITLDSFGKLWVNVDSKCVLRIGHCNTVTMDDPVRGLDQVYGDSKPAPLDLEAERAAVLARCPNAVCAQLTGRGQPPMYYILAPLRTRVEDVVCLAYDTDEAKAWNAAYVGHFA